MVKNICAFLKNSTQLTIIWVSEHLYILLYLSIPSHTLPPTFSFYFVPFLNNAKCNWFNNISDLSTGTKFGDYAVTLGRKVGALNRSTACFSPIQQHYISIVRWDLLLCKP